MSDPLYQLQQTQAWQQSWLYDRERLGAHEFSMRLEPYAREGARLAITYMQQQHEAYRERLLSDGAFTAAISAIWKGTESRLADDHLAVETAIRAAVQHAESATMPAANDREGTMGEMSTMTPEGDERIEWDPNDEKSVAKARTKFEDIRSKGGKVYTGVKTEELKPGNEVTEFDPSLGMLLAVPKLAGHPSAI